MKLIGLSLVSVCAAVLASPANAETPKCFKSSYEGHCVAVQVNGQASVKISKKTKKLLKEKDALSFSGGEVRYEIPTPVRGALALKAEFLPEAAGYFGPPQEVIAHVQPLDGQTMETDAELSTSGNVRAGGAAMVTVDNLVKDNRLRPGRYLLSVRVIGAPRWDHQVLFFEVVD